MLEARFIGTKRRRDDKHKVGEGEGKDGKREYMQYYWHNLTTNSVAEELGNGIEAEANGLT